MADKLTWQYVGAPIDGATIIVDDAAVAVGPAVREWELPPLDPGAHEIVVETWNAAGSATSTPLHVDVPEPDPVVLPPAPATDLRLVPVIDPGPAPVDKAVLTRDDFRYEGSFRLAGPPGYDMAWGYGLAHRYVDGALRFFTGGWVPNQGLRIAEVTPPSSLGDDPRSAPTATPLRAWGHVSQGAPDQGLDGIYWDEQDQRLYWSGGHPYNTDAPRAPSFGYSTLDDSTGAVTKAGPWALASRSVKMAEGGITPIPTWFADRYCPGMRLGAGFGGYRSIVAVGPASMGPALTAFDPSQLAGVDPIGNRFLLGYPFNPTPQTDPQRCTRDADYRSEFEGDWPPKGLEGWFTWTDHMFQAGCWVDTPTKSGLLFMPNISGGRVWYENSQLNAERAKHEWLVYAPSDLAEVAQSKRPQWAIQPAQRWDVQYPGTAYPMVWTGRGISPYGDRVTSGVTFDATTSTLYVAMKHCVDDGNFLSPQIVHVFRVV